MDRWDRHRLDMAARALIVIEAAGLPQRRLNKRGRAVQFGCGAPQSVKRQGAVPVREPGRG